MFPQFQYQWILTEWTGWHNKTVRKLCKLNWKKGAILNWPFPTPSNTIHTKLFFLFYFSEWKKHCQTSFSCLFLIFFTCFTTAAAVVQLGLMQVNGGMKWMNEYADVNRKQRTRNSRNDCYFIVVRSLFGNATLIAFHLPGDRTRRSMILIPLTRYLIFITVSLVRVSNLLGFQWCNQKQWS